MEKRAHYFAVGVFVVAIFFGVLVFAIWLAHISLTERSATYRIFFFQSVAGLGIGSQVLFNGVPVGSVSSIAIDRTDSRRVKVRIRIHRDVPVRTDSVASLRLQGITGVVLVEITPGTPGAPLLERKPGGLAPKIASQRSEIAEVMQSLPQLVQQVKALVARVDNVISPDNIKNVDKILADSAEVTGTLAAQRENMAKIIAETATAAAKLNRLADATDRTLAEAHATFGNTARLTRSDIPKLVESMRATSRAMTAAANQVQVMVSENRSAVRGFTTTGLSRLSRFIDQARVLTNQLSRLVQRIGDNPSVLLYGEKVPERTLK